MGAKRQKKRNIESAYVFENTTSSSYPCSSYRGLTVVRHSDYLTVYLFDRSNEQLLKYFFFTQHAESHGRRCVKELGPNSI